MIIYKPFKRTILTQGFGLKGTSPSMMDFYKSIGLKNGHNGVDYFLKRGDPIYFDVDTAGIVENTIIDNSGGLGIDIITKDNDKYYRHRYWHLMQFNVKAGQKVDTGDLLGWGDSTGRSTGDHLHRGLKVVKKDKYGNYQTTDKDNGYFGAINPQLFYQNIFVLDMLEILGKQKTILTIMVEIMKKVVALQIQKNKLYENQK